MIQKIAILEGQLEAKFREIEYVRKFNKAGLQNIANLEDLFLFLKKK